MPNDAVFTEVLEIKVLTDQFAQEMAKVEQIYADSLKRMPNIGKVSAATFAQSINDLNKTIENLSKGGTKVINDLGQNMLKTSEIIETQMQKMTSSVTTSLNRVNQQLTQYRANIQGGGSNNNGIISSFFSGLIPNNIPQFVGQIAKGALVWRAISESIELAGKVLMAPFAAVKEGMKYLEDFQERSSKVKTALLESVRFSKEWGDNVRIAGQEADNLIRKIDDLAVKLHAKSDLIQAGFTSFMEAGGRNLTPNIEDALNVSALAVAGLQSNNPNLQTRKVVTEIQQLVQGVLPSTSRLAASLGLSNQQLREMVEQAKQYHDLYQRLIVQAPGLVQRLAEANDRQVALKAALELYIKRWEGLIAQPLFDRFTKLLKQGIDFLDKHNDQIQAVGKIWGQLLDTVAEAISRLIKADWNAVLTAFRVMAGLATVMAVQIARVVDSFASWFRLAVAAKTIISPNADSYDRKLAQQEFKDTLVDNQDTTHSLNDLQQFGQNLISGNFKLPSSKGSGSEPANTPTHGINNAHKGSLQALRDAYNEQVKIIKAGEEASRKLIDESEALHTMSVEAAEQKRIASYTREFIALKAAAERYAKEVGANPNLSREDKAHALSTLRQQLTQDQKQVEQGEIEAHKKTALEHEAIEKSHLDGERQRASDHAKALLEMYRTLAQEKLISEEELVKAEIDAENRAYREEVMDLRRKQALYAKSTSEFARVEEQLATLKARHADKELEYLERVRQAARRDYQERLNAERNLLSIQAQRAGAQSSGQLPGSLGSSSVRTRAIQAQVNEAEFAYAAAVQAVMKGEQEHAANLAELKATEEEARLKLEELDNELRKVQDPLGSWVENLRDSWDAAEGAGQKLGVVTDALKNLWGTITGIINQYEQGRKQGGVLGGVGSLLSSGPVSDLLSSIPVVGAFVKPIGAVFSLLGGLFTAEARRIGEKVKKEISQIEKDYSLGHSSLQDTINKLEAERVSAIQRLSGKKGGKDQLNQILPQLDGQIEQLRKQAEDIRATFDANLDVMLQHGQVLQQWAKTWQDINKQVKDYINAGGDLAKANAFLNAQLAQQRSQLQDDLNSGEKEAIDDAIRLNDLLQQRIDLVKQEQSAEFDLINRDSIERRGSSSISTGMELAQKRADFQKQLGDIDSQISLETQKVSAEKQVFNIASDIAALKERSNALELIALDQQLQKYRQMQDLLRQTAGFTFGGSPDSNFTPGISAPVINAPITVNINGADGVNADEIADHINRRLRGFLSEA
jgi:hypothetical protein